jgi:hypothetical protein
VAGTPRSGGSAITHSFDSHPEVLAWPFHFKYFSFFRIASGGNETANVQELNRTLLEVFRDVFFNVILTRDLKLQFQLGQTAVIDDQYLNVGGFSFETFKEILLGQRNKSINAFDYLDNIFNTLKLSNMDYAEKSVSYYLMNLTSARGLDWGSEQELGKHKIIFSYREAKNSYSSLKNRYFKKDPDYCLLDAVSPFRQKNLLYWLEHYRRLSSISKSYVGRTNFVVVPFSELQASPVITLNNLCSELSISWDSSLESLTILGMPYGGNANQEDINTGKISDKPSEMLVPISRFEESLFDRLNLFGFLKTRESKKKKVSVYRLLILAIQAAFCEATRRDIVRGRTDNMYVSIIGRVGILASFVFILLVLKKPKLVRRILRRNNPHMDEMSFWD